MQNDSRPPSTKEVVFQTKDGWHRGFYLRDANKYVRGVNRWKDTETEEWFDDEDVTAWVVPGEALHTKY